MTPAPPPAGPSVGVKTVKRPIMTRTKANEDNIVFG